MINHVNHVNRGQWQKGQSGNPKGRPRSERALANALREVGERDSFGDLPNKAFMARLVWQAIATGQITLVGERTLTLTAKEWLDLVKWLNLHVDGSIHTQDVPTAADKRPSPPDRIVIRYGPPDEPAPTLSERSAASGPENLPEE
jgi:hypothetical protein